MFRKSLESVFLSFFTNLSQTRHINHHRVEHKECVKRVCHDVIFGCEKNITHITQITQKKHSPLINPLRERPLMKKSVMCVIRVMCVTCVSQKS